VIEFLRIVAGICLLVTGIILLLGLRRGLSVSGARRERIPAQVLGASGASMVAGLGTKNQPTPRLPCVARERRPAPTSLHLMRSTRKANALLKAALA